MMELAKTYDRKKLKINCISGGWKRILHAKIDPNKNRNHRGTAAEHYGTASYGSCFGQHSAGYIDKDEKNAGLLRIWYPNRPCQHRYEARTWKKLRKKAWPRRILGEKSSWKSMEWKSSTGQNRKPIEKAGEPCTGKRTVTMDEACPNRYEVFVRLYEKGLIYRGKGLSTGVRFGTSISDAEVEYEGKKAILWHIKYP